MPEDAPLVKPVAAVLHRDPGLLGDALAALERVFSPVDVRGPAHPFDMTDYYEAELGPGLQRTLVAFRDLRPPTFLVEAKHRASAVEDRFRRDGRRRVNVDVGYLDLHKLVLASWKARGHKLYLDRGVYADLTLLYGGGRFRPLEWSFPDFRTGRYDADLHAVRERLREQLRAFRAAPGRPPG